MEYQEEKYKQLNTPMPKEAVDKVIEEFKRHQIQNLSLQPQ